MRRLRYRDGLKGEEIESSTCCDMDVSGLGAGSSASWQSSPSSTRLCETVTTTTSLHTTLQVLYQGTLVTFSQIPSLRTTTRSIP